MSRNSFELAGTSPHKIVGIVEFRGELILATERGVWRKTEKGFIPIPLLYESEPPNDLHHD